MSDEPKRRGRPKEFVGTPVSVRLTPAIHDSLAREALSRRVDLSAVIRERLQSRVSQILPSGQKSVGSKQ